MFLCSIIIYYVMLFLICVSFEKNMTDLDHFPSAPPLSGKESSMLLQQRQACRSDNLDQVKKFPGTFRQFWKPGCFWRSFYVTVDLWDHTA